MTYQEAIDQSIAQNEIVTLDHDVTTMDQLSAECDDCVDNCVGTTEYWGTREDGEEWRVHVRKSED